MFGADVGRCREFGVPGKGFFSAGHEELRVVKHVFVEDRERTSGARDGIVGRWGEVNGER